jgi:hypothetical protein
MDTKFWGPSGWRLLHLIAAGPHTASNRTFWELLPFVLPCKFCRASLTEYYEQHPIPSKTADFAPWLYVIHNCVNKKLRDQGQNVPPDPPKKEVLAHYEEHIQQGCTKTYFPGWDFLFCIADNHPDASPSVPMPDTPEQHPTTLKERNRWNLLTAKERKSALRRFWLSLPDVLPFEEWRQSWHKHAGSVRIAVSSRRSALSWLWKIRCGMEADLQQLSNLDFHGLCKQIKTHRSGCSTSKRAKTCRAIRGGKRGRKTRRLKQR